MTDVTSGIDMSRFLLAIGVVGLGLLALIGVMWVIRNRPSSPFVKGGRTRQPRLAVIDAAAVDARRRIILVRRDNIEHLIMIGGPTDVVIESNIGAEAAYAGPALVSDETKQPASLALPELALELPAPPEAPTAVPSDPSPAVSTQSQSAPPLKAKLWPATAKMANETKAALDDLEKNISMAETAVVADTKALDALFDIQEKTAPIPVQATLPVVAEPAEQIARPSAQAAFSEKIASLGATPARTPVKYEEPEIRNPYLEAETVTPQAQRTPTPPSQPVSIPAAPARASSIEPQAPLAQVPVRQAPPVQTPVVTPPEMPTPAVAATQRPEPVSQNTAQSTALPTPELQVPVSVPVEAEPAIAEPVSVPAKQPIAMGDVAPRQSATAPAGSLVKAPSVDLDSLISGDFLDNARTRVLAPAQEPVATPQTVANIPAPPAPAAPQSAFAKILEQEIKSGLPETRYDAPRAAPAVQQPLPSLVPKPVHVGAVQPQPAPPMPAAVQPPRPVQPAALGSIPLPASRKEAAPAVTPEKRSIAEILEAARNRVIPADMSSDTAPQTVSAVSTTQPVSQTPEIGLPALAPLAEAKPSDVAKPQATPAPVISSPPHDLSIFGDLEKMWETEFNASVPDIKIEAPKNGQQAPKVELAMATPERSASPVAPVSSAVKQLAEEAEFAKIEQELSLDDEMARVLGEFSITRKK